MKRYIDELQHIGLVRTQISKAVKGRANAAQFPSSKVMDSGDSNVKSENNSPVSSRSKIDKTRMIEDNSKANSKNEIGDKRSIMGMENNTTQFQSRIQKSPALANDIDRKNRVTEKDNIESLIKKLKKHSSLEKAKMNKHHKDFKANRYPDFYQQIDARQHLKSGKSFIVIVFFLQRMSFD